MRPGRAQGRTKLRPGHPRHFQIQQEDIRLDPPQNGQIRNLDRIAMMGCGVDLDDFGTGNASITTIRQFSLQRLKIDRSFVRGVDYIRDQQKLVTAILALAEQLGLESLAEGVETQAEHAMLAQLGCGHVQGYVISKPLPPEEVANWLRQHRERLPRALRIEMRAR